MRQKPLILIADDEKDFLEIFSTKLQAAGYDTITAKNEAEILAKTKETIPDLILMDIYMPPGSTGTDIALSIKQTPECKDCKIAFLTNLKDPWPALRGDKKSVARELGMEDFLQKTDDLDHLISSVQEILSRGEGGNPPTNPLTQD
jgi:CheY-like chemotaxis protein